MIKNGFPTTSSLGSGPRLVVLVGNPKPRSRTLTVAELVAHRVADVTGGSVIGTVDLADYSDVMFKWPESDLNVIAEGISAADIVVVATPVFKGSFTGLLKSFLDRYPYGALAGVTAIPVMTGADQRHALAVDHTLTPLLAELGASQPARGLFFEIGQLEVAATVVNDWSETNLGSLRGATPHYQGATR